ncbi:MAG: filamentous hemagglutinin family protein [Methylophilus sp.]
MNSGIYRLVFNTSRGLWMVVSEHVGSYQSGKNSTARSARRRERRSDKATLNILLLGVTLSGVFSIAFADTILPVNTIPTGLQVIKGNITINAPVVNPLNAAGQALNIDQSSLKGIMQGTNFNIGAASAVNFNHTGGAGSATLIRINGPKSIIEGALNSPKGSIYLINQNGILFANGSKVNVNGLVASALNLSDDDFMSDYGHLNAAKENLSIPRAAYIWEGDAAGYKEALVQVEPNAQIKAALGGSVMLFAPTVINQGSIETTEGQVAMAAGEKVYLSYALDLNSGTTKSAKYQYKEDSVYRGLAGVLVEVDSYKKKDSDASTVPAEIAGQVTNDTMGRILSQRGNVTLAGFMVNQNGRITATSSVSQKGSIRLLARDTIKGRLGAEALGAQSFDADQSKFTDITSLPDGVVDTSISGTRTGELNIGANSITAILPEDTAALSKTKEIFSAPQVGEPAITQAARNNGETTYVEKIIAAVNTNGADITGEQIYNASNIEAIGRQVTIGDNAKIVNPGGHISISAQKDGIYFNQNGANLSDTASRLFIGKNSLIDASGLNNVPVSMESNFVEALLTLTDLKDDPLNRDGFLYREKVWFDIRNTPDSRVADLAGFVKQVPHSLGEKLATAGNVSLKSEGDLIQSKGSKVDVSGGTVQYQTGLNKESWLTDINGKSYALGDAPTDTIFTGFLGGSNSLQRQEAGYTEGKASGKVEVQAYNLALDGQFTGGAVYGQNQRETANLGGELNIKVLNDVNNVGVQSQHYLKITKASTLDEAFTSTDVLPVEKIKTVEIDAGMLSRSGFEEVSLSTQGNVSVDAKVNMALGGKLALSGRNIKVNQDIIAHGGDISLSSQTTVGTVTADDTHIQVADGVSLDTSGLWTNDALGAAPVGRIMTDGGNVTLNSADEITLGKGSLVDVSSGGWLKGDKTLVNGDAGSINIASQVGQNGVDEKEFTYKAPILNGELRGYALGKGGSLSITAPFVTIGSSGFSDARELHLTQDFFQNGGFTQYNLTGRDGVLVRGDANVNMVAKNYVLNRDFSTKATGSKVASFATTKVQPDYLRSSTSLALSTMATPLTNASQAYAASGVTRGSVVVETGANIKVDSQGPYEDKNGNKLAPSISISAWDNQLYVDGTLQANGGDINLIMNGDATSGVDTGYNAAQAIWLDSHAKLLASGYSEAIIDGKGKKQGTVYDGGNINIVAKKGYVVTKAGSQIDVSGSADVFDIKGTQGYTKTKIASNAGDVSLSAREGMLLDGGFNAKSSGGLAGGLEVRLTRGDSTQLGLPSSPYPGSSVDTFNGNPGNAPDQLWYIDISQSETSVPTSLTAGDSVQSAAGGLAKVSADNIMNAGFADVALKSEYGVRFTGDVDLKTSRSVEINARVVEATADSNVNLTAPHVTISNKEDALSVKDTTSDIAIRPKSAYNAVTAIAGTANLTVNANLIDLTGHTAASGFNKTTFNSTGEVRLTGISDPNDTSLPVPTGEFNTVGALTFNAREIYPTTFSDFTINVDGLGSHVTFNGTGQHSQVLSALGKLTVNAETIDQSGVLLAPFGTIALNASDTLNLNAGSLTSVSAEGALIPFGYTEREGLDYLYDYGVSSAQFKSTADAKTGIALTDRAVELNAKNVNQNADSKIDISAGGDLLSYEWIPGIGGSTDVLANGAKQDAFGAGTTNTWAIMPVSNQTYASYDAQYWQGSDIKAGDAVYLSGVPGLAAGYYTLLPARYALLPGAMLVSAVSGTQDRAVGQNQTLLNGSTLTSGHLAAYTSDGYVQTSRTAGFVVRPGSDAHQLAQYNTSTASKYFKGNTQAQQTSDAGRLSIEATNSLVLKGILDALPGQNGRGAEVDIAAPKLLVVASGEAEGQVIKDGETYLAIDQDSLENFNASSLVLGGTRNHGQLEVTSSKVRMSENAQLSASEVILAATDSVQLDAGATLKGVGKGGANKDLTIGDVNTGQDGDGALVRVSGEKAIQLTRSNTDNDRGDLIVNNGATIQGDGAILLDASKRTSLEGNLTLADGAGLGLSSSRISLGSPDSNEAVADGLWLKQSQLESFANAGSLNLKSQSTIDLYGDVSFGNQQFDLTLQTAGLAGYQNTGKTSTITTRAFTLENPNNVAFQVSPALANGTVPSLGAGQLNINAETIVVGDNTVRVAGYDQVNLTANKEIALQGNVLRDGANEPQNKLIADKNLTLSAAQVTANQRADAAVIANGLLKVVGANTAQTTLNTKSSVGSQLKLSGEQVLLAGNTANQQAASVNIQGGVLTVQAVGTNTTDHVTMENGARISAQGSTYTLNDQTVNLAAGKLNLISNSGNVDVQQGAEIDLTAAGTGDAGQIMVSAVNGEAKLAGTIKAAGVGQQGKNAIANVDAKRLDIHQATSALSTFSGSQTYRVREGDITVAAADKIVAKKVKIEVDKGAITVNGIIDASGDKGGSIGLYAQNDLTINTDAKLLAKGLADKTSTAGSAGDGGEVVLSTQVGVIRVSAPDANGQGGALIDVGGDVVGDVKGNGGHVIYRAARTGAGVNVDSASTAAITGAKQIQVEAVKQYQYTNIGSAEQNAIKADIEAFAGDAANIVLSNARDGKSAAVVSGIEVASNGNLTIASDWDLSGIDATPGILTLRAANSLNINGKIDAIKTTKTGNALSKDTSKGAWSYRLVGGADSNSSNPETVTEGAGDVVLKDAKYVRTGTGFVQVNAGGDVKLGTENGAGASIYTIGTDAATLAGFNTYSNTQLNEYYGNAGGDVSVYAMGDINGSSTAANNQNVNNWFTHSYNGNNKNAQVRWWIRDEKVSSGGFQVSGFTNGIGTLAGGDVDIQAGGSVSDLQIAAATNGRMAGDVNSDPQMANFVELGGGDVSVKADGSVNQTLLFASHGDINTTAEGNISTKLALMDSQIDLTAKGDIEISAVSNPTSKAIPKLSQTANKIQFYTYSNEAAVNVTSYNGSVDISSDGSVFPANLYAAAPEGDINLGVFLDVDNLLKANTPVALYPSVTGNATLLAGNDLNVGGFVISDVDPESIATITTPNIKDTTLPDLTSYIGASSHTEGLLHLNDVKATRLYAGRNAAFFGAIPFVSPKQTQIIAGYDIVDPNVVIQNIKPTDVSVIQAGNDIRYNDPVRIGDTLQATPSGIEIGGPGRLHLIANRNIDLGASQGVLSVGNANNPYLPEQGADIMVMPGAGAIADYNAILSAYVDPTSQYSNTYLPQLTVYMRERTGDEDLDATQALAAFKLLDKQAQAAFINKVFYAELDSGSGNGKIPDYSRAERAILTMFPEFTTNTSLVSQSGSITEAFGKIANEAITHAGNLNLFYSQIKSERGGDIELLVPGGNINAGLAVSSGLAKSDADLGVVSQRGGDILSFVRDNFQVNQSRVFTLGGTDILIYSALGDIDSGKGAKTASSTPPPVLRIKNGQVIYDYSAAVSGSGIGALASTGGTPGRVALYAPHGAIIASEAGIRGGKIDIGTPVLIGGDNIVGNVSGLPEVSTSGLSVALPATDGSAGQQSDQFADVAKQDMGKALVALPSIISVEVISLGEDTTSNLAEPKATLPQSSVIPSVKTDKKQTD